jgi:hypothetical protein
MDANQSVERMGASRSGQFQFLRRWRLAPTAHARRSVCSWLVYVRPVWQVPRCIADECVDHQRYCQ